MPKFSIKEDFADIPELAQFDGVIEWPDTVTARMFMTWWDASRYDETKEPGSLYNRPLMAQWRGAIALITKYGKIEVDGIAPADMTEAGDNVPLEIISLVGKLMDIDMTERVSLKKFVERLRTT